MIPYNSKPSSIYMFNAKFKLIKIIKTINELFNSSLKKKLLKNSLNKIKIIDIIIKFKKIKFT